MRAACKKADHRIDGLKGENQMFGTIKETLRDSFSLRNDIASPEEIQKDIEAGAEVKGTNMCILILAILIASIGLNMNSTAVIIGAMLISPLMGGIIAIGYGVAVNDLSASKRAGIGLAFQVIICIITSTIYFSLSPISAAHSEILARTSPSVWDVLIAVFGGLAGVIGITRKEKSNVIPGVAIATALMPPLCTAGYGLAQGNFKYFLGAMYLFFINSFFICISSIIIFKILKLPCKELIDKQAKHKLYRNMTILAVITIIPSIFLAYQLITDSITNNNINKFLENELNYEDSQVIQSKVNDEKDTLEIAVLGNRLSQHEIEHLNEKLAEYGLGDMTLKITQPSMDGVLTADDLQSFMDQDEEKIALAIKDNEIAGLKDKISKQNETISQYEKYDFNLEELHTELKALYPNIRDFSLGIQKSYIAPVGNETSESEEIVEETETNEEIEAEKPDESDESTETPETPETTEKYKETLFVVLNTTENLSPEDLNKLESWFATKTSEQNVEIIELPV